MGNGSWARSCPASSLLAHPSAFCLPPSSQRAAVGVSSGSRKASGSCLLPSAWRLALSALLTPRSTEAYSLHLDILTLDPRPPIPQDPSPSSFFGRPWVPNIRISGIRWMTGCRRVWGLGSGARCRVQRAKPRCRAAPTAASVFLYVCIVARYPLPLAHVSCPVGPDNSLGLGARGPEAFAHSLLLKCSKVQPDGLLSGLA